MNFFIFIVITYCNKINYQSDFPTGKSENV